MPDSHPSPADIVRRLAAMARVLADTARFHKEPEEAARFEQIAAEGEARAQHLDDLAHARILAADEPERQAIAEHDAAVRKMDHPWRRPRG
jgi:hypothetical protein